MTDVTLDKMHLLLWYLILVNTFIFQSTGSTKVFLADNGYSNLLVAIAPTAPKHQAQTIIDNIKVILFFLDSFICITHLIYENQQIYEVMFHRIEFSINSNFQAKIFKPRL